MTGNVIDQEELCEDCTHHENDCDELDLYFEREMDCNGSYSCENFEIKKIIPRIPQV